MGKIIHPVAGAVAILTIAIFWLSTALSELFAPQATVLAVKTAIPWGFLLLVPTLMAAGGSGFAVANGRRAGLIGAKIKRMPLIATNGILVLIPSALFLASKAKAAEFDAGFYSSRSRTRGRRASHRRARQQCRCVDDAVDAHETGFRASVRRQSPRLFRTHSAAAAQARRNTRLDYNALAKIEGKGSDRAIFQRSPRIEIMFGGLKDWRRIAMRYDRAARPFFSAICVAATVDARSARADASAAPDGGRISGGRLRSPLRTARAAHGRPCANARACRRCGD